MDFGAFERKLSGDGAHPLLIEAFRSNYRRFASGQTGLIPRGELVDVGPIPSLESLHYYRQRGRDALGRALIIKLNGGLGTSMGLDRAKSLLPVKDGLSFLDILARQTLHLRQSYGVHLPLLLMNSYNTESDSLAALAKYPALAAGQSGIPLSFLQHRVPKVDAKAGGPVSWPSDPEKEWCPPGHGDMYVALLTSGLLELLLQQGFEYAFISNADNLGSTLSMEMLGYMASQGLPFMMEVTERTEADKKGGHLARRRGQGFLLRELAQCPPDEVDDFQDILRHRYFNTNNLWIRLSALRAHVQEAQGRIDLPIIVNRKTVDPKDKHSPEVVQIETAVGAAIGVFPGAAAIRVPRTRFAPVKTTEDLLGLWSDAFVLTEDWRLQLRPGLKGPPVIRLDPAFYKVMDQFQQRFPCGAPSLAECESLTVQGDHVFGREVKVQGAVLLRNTSGKAVHIPDGYIIGAGAAS